MTAATQPAPAYVQPPLRSHAEIYADLQAETMILKERDLAYFNSDIAPLYKQHPGAIKDAAEAQVLLDKLRAFSQGGALGLAPKAAQSGENVPFTPKEVVAPAESEPAPAPAPVESAPATPVPAPAAPAPAAPSPAPATPAEEEVVEEEEVAEEPAEDVSDPAPAELVEEEAGPAPAPLLASVAAPSTETLVEPQWPEGAVSAGWISQLAATLADGEAVLFALTRVGDEVRVVVQPKPIQGETSTAIPLQTQGLPGELDESLVSDLLAYREGRSYARQTVSYLDQVKAQAEAAQKAAQKEAAKKAGAGKKAAPAKATPAPKPTSGKVTLTTIPAGSALMTFGPDGKKVELQPGVQRELPPGKYTSKASFPEHASKELTFEVKVGTTQTLEIRLESEMAKLFG